MTTPTDEAVAAAKNAPELLTFLQTMNPALYAQLTGSLGTYGKSAAAPVVGAIVGAVVAHYGIACTTAVTTGCWSADFIGYVTDSLVLAGTAAGALVMHWVSKSPARAAVNSAPAAPAQKVGS